MNLPRVLFCTLRHASEFFSNPAQSPSGSSPSYILTKWPWYPCCFIASICAKMTFLSQDTDHIIQPTLFFSRNLNDIQTQWLDLLVLPCLTSRLCQPLPPVLVSSHTSLPFHSGSPSAPLSCFVFLFSGFFVCSWSTVLDGSFSLSLIPSISVMLTCLWRFLVCPEWYPGDPGPHLASIFLFPACAMEGWKGVIHWESCTLRWPIWTHIQTWEDKPEEHCFLIHSLILQYVC